MVREENEEIFAEDFEEDTDFDDADFGEPDDDDFMEDDDSADDEDDY